MNQSRGMRCECVAAESDDQLLASVATRRTRVARRKQPAVEGSPQQVLRRAGHLNYSLRLATQALHANGLASYLQPIETIRRATSLSPPLYSSTLTFASPTVTKRVARLADDDVDWCTRAPRLALTGESKRDDLNETRTSAVSGVLMTRPEVDTSPVLSISTAYAGGRRKLELVESHRLSLLLEAARDLFDDTKRIRVASTASAIASSVRRPQLDREALARLISNTPHSEAAARVVLENHIERELEALRFAVRRRLGWRCM